MTPSNSDTPLQVASNIVEYLDSIIVDVVAHKDNLLQDYSYEVLERFSSFYQSLTQKFDNHLNDEEDRFYSFLRRSHTRSQLAIRIAESSHNVAKLFEDYATRKKRYSRVMALRLINNTLISIRSLQHACDLQGETNEGSITTQSTDPLRVITEGKEVKSFTLDPMTIPDLLKALDFLFGEGSKILQERRERHQISQNIDKTNLQEEKLKKDSASSIRSREIALSQRLNQDSWLPAETKVKHLLSLIDTHTKNYYLAQEQYAKFGSSLVPQIVIHNLDEAEIGIETGIKELESVLSKVYKKEVKVSDDK